MYKHDVKGKTRQILGLYDPYTIPAPRIRHSNSTSSNSLSFDQSLPSPSSSSISSIPSSPSRFNEEVFEKLRKMSAQFLHSFDPIESIMQAVSDAMEGENLEHREQPEPRLFSRSPLLKCHEDRVPTAETASQKKFLREVLLPLFFGLLIGYLIGTLYTSKSKEEDAHAHSFVKEVELGSYEYANGSYFFLRCLVLVHPDAKKPLSFIMAIRDTYGQQCNQTIFYTANPEVQRRVNDQQVYLIQQNSNGFYWNFFRTALKHSSAVPAMWTIVLDEQVFLKVSNLRRTLVNFDFRDKVLLGRVMESIVFNLFPFMSNARLSLQAGIVMSNSALQSLLLCDNYILPRTTEKTILECSQEYGITVIDPVDEARMHLFHYRDVKSLISNSQDGGHSCCSDHAVTFGQHSFKEIRMAHYASETWVVFGTHGAMEVNKTYAIDRSLLVRTTTLKPKTTVPTKKPDTKKAVVKKEEPKKEKPKKKPGLL